MKCLPPLYRVALVVCVFFEVASCGSASPSAPTPTKIVSLQGNLAFDNVIVGLPRTATLTIVNSGNVSLNVTGVVVPDGYTANWTSGVVSPGVPKNVTITFAPSLAGSYNGTISVVSDQTSGTNTIPITGMALSNLLVGWVGTQTTSFPDGARTVACSMTWTVTLESITGQFSGTWQTGIQCGLGSGTLTGTISSTNSLSGLSFNPTVPILAPVCTRVDGGSFDGALSGNSAVLQSSDTIRCPGSADVVRSTTLAMNKQ